MFRELGWVDHEKGFVIGVSSRRTSIEGSRDHFAVVDHSELVVQLVTPVQSRGADGLFLQSF
jgi:hypothetical protein